MDIKEMAGRFFTLTLRLIFAFTLLCTSLWFVLGCINTNIRIQSIQGQRLLKISLRDRFFLRFFLEQAMIFEEGSYVLMGSKPMWMGAYIKPFSFENHHEFLDSISIKNLAFYWGLQSFKAHQNKFLGKNIIVYVEKNPFFKCPTKSEVLLLINRKHFEQTVQDYASDFSFVLGRNDIQGKDLLLEAETKPLIGKVLKKHEGLVGTLFGFGRNNAWFFEARDHGFDIGLADIWQGKVFSFYENRPEESFFFNTPLLKATIAYPLFLADPESTESQKLRSSYLQTRETILEYYSEGDFLEKTLSLFSQMDS